MAEENAEFAVSHQGVSHLSVRNSASESILPFNRFCLQVRREALTVLKLILYSELANYSPLSMQKECLKLYLTPQ